jgi:rhamnosyl/mannosyltransferase
VKVVHVFKDFYPPTVGGVEQHMAVLCRGLAREAEVTVLVPSRSRRRVEEAIDGVRVIRTPEHGRYLSAPLCPGMARELRALGPDLVHLHFPNPTGDLAYLLSGCRAPVVMTYHADIVRRRPLLWLYRPALARLERRLARVIVASEEYLASSAFLARRREKCVVIPFGIDLDEFALRDGEAAEVEGRRRDHGERLVLFLGALRRYKGLEVLIEAMREVSGRLLVAGPGARRERLEALARERGVGDRVAFLGEVPARERRLLLHACEALVLPSTDRSEAFGIAPLEAMACGKPVVASDLPTGVRLVTRHEETGLLVPPGDPRALASALERLLGDEALRAALGKAAQRRVEREFTAERMVARTLEVYGEALSGGPARVASGRGAVEAPARAMASARAGREAAAVGADDGSAGQPPGRAASGPVAEAPRRVATAPVGPGPGAAARALARKVKVLRVIARLNVGGPAIHVINLTAGLDARRFASTLVSGTENPGEGSMLDLALQRGVRPVVIPEIVGQATFNLRDLAALAKLHRLIRRVRPDVVHTHAAKPGVLGRVAARLAGVPVVVHTFHGHILRGYYGPATTWLLRRMERLLARLTDRIVAVSEEVKQDLVRCGVAPPEKIDVIPLGLDLGPFLAGDTHRGAFRRELGLDGAAPLVGIVGRVFPIKNHRLFLRAAARVAAGEPEARFVVVGDGILRGEMEALARDLGIGDRAVFTGWRRDLPRIYADLDLLVVSSDNEGTPVSAIEAMAAGCPVVATRVGGLPDLVQDGETGRLVPPGDPEALAAAILGLLRDRERARRMGEAGRERARERYRVERLCKDIESLYDRLLPERSDPGVISARPSWDRACKRLLDLGLSTAGLVGSAPLWGLAALAIKLEDAGPVFYPQERWGRHGRPMRVLKFRTMIPEANPTGVTVQAAAGDPRVTRVGRLLRATAFDEIPQLLNIWRGEMSFVGPRALPINERQQREDEPDLPDERIPGFRERLQVTPGLTGIAQIWAPRDVPRRQKFRYDLLYVRRQSLWLDLRLILLSFWITFRGAWERQGRKL